VVVVPADTTVETGATVAFQAYLEDRAGNRKDTAFVWSLAGPAIGNLTPDGVFNATRSGAGMVVASVGKLSGTAGIRVKDPAWTNGMRVRITPIDTALLVGQTVQMHAELVHRDGSVKDTVFAWEVSNGFVGSIGRSDGFFTALAKGHTTVFARVGSLFGRAHVVVLHDTTGWGRPNAGLHVVVLPRDTVTFPGGQIQYSASLLDSNGAVIDTAFAWSVDGTFGSISETGLFTADTLGHGFVYAVAGTLAGKAHVAVVRDSTQADSLRERYRKNRIRLVVEPKDTLVAIGNTVAFKAYLVDTSGIRTETTVRWDLVGRKVGSLDASGLFTAQRRGIGLVQAKKERYTAMARVMVVGSLADTAQSDSAHVRFRNRDGQLVGHMHRLGEKDVLKISGLPFPLNFLNGGELVFQPGSLAGDIRIDISIPESALVDTSVGFPEGILTGASFQVFVDGVPVHPFPFGAPVQVVFPLKHGLLEQWGLIPEDLGVFFQTAGGLDSSGVSNVVVDTSAGVVVAEVEHFSDVVVARKTSAVSAVSGRATEVPAMLRLVGNYPNPFNPGTEIRFETGREHVRLTVYNILGREIRNLFDGRCEPGSHTVRWDGRDAGGLPSVSGIYLVRLEANGFSATRRIVLIR
jgi:hypothetical protein